MRLSSRGAGRWGVSSNARNAYDPDDLNVRDQWEAFLRSNEQELVKRRTGVKAVLADQALFCVAKGTGVALEHLDTYKRMVIGKR